MHALPNKVTNGCLGELLDEPLHGLQPRCVTINKPREARVLRNRKQPHDINEERHMISPV